MSAIVDPSQGRYLLFLDILGFSDLVTKKSPDEIYAVIDKALQAFDRWEKLSFRTIYFSDTFLFYQEPKGYGNWAFSDVYAIGGMVLSALLAQRIPARGAITFGQFEIRSDSSNKRQVYFGSALIEAYGAEQRENWIGISIQQSAWAVYEANNIGVIAALQNERVWRKRHDGVLLLNPFLKLPACYYCDLNGEIDKPYLEWDAPAFPNDILGFRFLHEQASEYARAGDFSGKVAVKYHVTIAFLKEVLGNEIYEWGVRIGGSV